MQLGENGADLGQPNISDGAPLSCAAHGGHEEAKSRKITHTALLIGCWKYSMRR